MAVTAFREAYVTAGLDDSTSDFSDFGARKLRYQLAWASYENTAYRNVHAFSTSLRQQYGLYRYIRNLYSPAYRLGEFYRSHIFGGQLSPDAGPDGSIPIETDNDSLRRTIAELWKWSRWDVNKDVLALQGAVLGDVALQVVDDVGRGRVYLDIMHPGSIKEATLDPFGNVKGYTLEETRADPEGRSRTVTYTEKVSRDGDLVVYQTYLNNQPYAWPENTDRMGEPLSEWAEPYGFVPLVLIKHNDVGLQWGWSELHPMRSKAQEADDLASQLSDQIRKTVDPIWLMRGMKPTTITMSGADTSTDRPEPGREELQAFWNVPVDGGADAMVADLKLDQALAHLQGILAEIERDYPELGADIATSSGDASGRALRVARQRAVVKVLQRRANYDGGLVRAQQMAVAIGGWRGYDGYAGFGLESYQAGDLAHSIGDRPVFDSDPLDIAEIETAEWGSIKVAIEAGATLRGILTDKGWSEERIAILLGGEGND